MVVNPDGQPPEPPVNAPAGDGSAPRAFAVNRLFAGVRTFQDVESADAWKGFGFDVDNQLTTSDYSDHCTPSGGAAPNNVFPDAPSGIDNAFGKVLVPILKTAAATKGDLEDMANAPIESGDFTFIFDLPSLGSGADYSLLPSSYLEGRQQSGSTWLKAPESFTGNQPKLGFPDAYSTDNVWVSRRVNGTLPVKLAFVGTTLVLSIHRPLISAELAADHNSVTRGIISGVLDTEELVAQMELVLGGIDLAFCDGAAAEGILNQVRQASDIMSDGSQGPGTECNGISIGLGFTAEAVTIGALGQPDPPISDPCNN